MSLFRRNEKFFELLERQSGVACEAATALHKGLAEGGDSMAANADLIGGLEREADQIAQEVITSLHSTFITPVDPEDLHALTTALDDVIDSIEDSSFRLATYRIGSFPAGMLEMAGIIKSACVHLQVAMRELRAGNPIQEPCIEVNRLENAADELVRRMVTELFDSGMDAMTIMKQKEIYDFLESAVDRCEDVADVLETVKVKN